MSSGPGRYDAQALRILREELARGVVLIVLDGKRGDGCSCKVAGATPELAKERHRLIPDLLRMYADAMDATLEEDLADPASGLPPSNN